MGIEKNFNEGNWVWLFTKSLSLKENAKLVPKWIGPFEFMECLIGVCHLCFPSTICIHPVVNLAFLKTFVPLTKEDPSQRVKQVTLKLNRDECQMKEILGHCKKRKYMEYFVLWVDRDKTWEPVYHLWNALETLWTYLHHHPHLLTSHWLFQAQPQREDSVKNLRWGWDHEEGVLSLSLSYKY